MHDGEQGMLMIELEAFHFLRPLWLAGIPTALVLVSLAGLRQRITRQWRGQIAPHLLPHLVVKAPRNWIPGPRLWMVLMLSLACMALAGPSWQREPPAFADDRGQLMIVLDLSPSMNAIDVAPTRLARAKQKLGELLALRQNARTGLVVFADSAHTVLPPTDDPALIRSYLSTLESSLMPPASRSAHSGLAAALTNAQAMLARDTDNPGGTLLVISDGDHLSTAEAPAESPVDGGILWLFGNEAPAPMANTSQGVSSGLRNGNSVARDDGAITSLIERKRFTRIDATVRDDDVQTVHRQIVQQLALTTEASSSRFWQDGGLWLLGPLVLFGALGFRRGWSIRW